MRVFQLNVCARGQPAPDRYFRVPDQGSGGERLAELNAAGKFLEAQRLSQRTLFDLDMLAELGDVHQDTGQQLLGVEDVLADRAPWSLGTPLPGCTWAQE